MDNVQFYRNNPKSIHRNGRRKTNLIMKIRTVEQFLFILIVNEIFSFKMKDYTFKKRKSIE